MLGPKLFQELGEQWSKRILLQDRRSRFVAFRVLMPRSPRRRCAWPSLLDARLRLGSTSGERALERVAFETKFPKDQIELVPLDLPLDHPMRSGVHLGVKACSQQAVYVFTNQLGWVMNTDSSAPNPPEN